MTVSILAYDEKSGSYGGAAATGSLCVGGWVLRGDAESGMSASQGSLPSTFWGASVLEAMKAGVPAEDAVRKIIGDDPGRDHRQLAALDAADASGGDSRGLMSAALLVVNSATPPLTLRIDYSETPLGDLRALHGRATSGDYARWTTHVPTLDDPCRSDPFGGENASPHPAPIRR